MNPTAGRVRSALVTALLAIPASMSLGVENLPNLGDRSAGILSSLEEQKLGRDFMRQARSRLNFIDDQELNEYISGLGAKLVPNSEGPDQQFKFYVVRDNNLNAFAVPGGHVTIHTGLISAAKSEPELAAVLAHEIAHVTQSHLARMLDRSQRHALPTLAALIAAIMVGGQAGQAAIIATQASLIDKQLQYTRGFEGEADAIGIRTLANSGYDAAAMTRFLERMQRWGRTQESGAPEFLRTHPLTENRIAETASRARRYPVPPAPDDHAYFHVQARIRALFSNAAPIALEEFRARLDSGNYEHLPAERYGYALALMSNRRYHEARTQIAQLLQVDPNRLSYHLARAQIEDAAGKYAAAVTVLQNARTKFPNQRILEVYYVNALIKTKRYRDAKQLLKRRLLKHNDPSLHRLLARAEGESGNPLGAHQALAEHHHLVGNPREALRQLSLAKRYVGESDYARASVEAKIEQIEGEILATGEKLKPRQ